MMGLMDFLLAKNLFLPLAQLCAALIALFAVIITQIFLSKRSEIEIDAKFQLLEKEQQHKKEAENRKERLQKIEEVFAIIQESREIVNATFYIYKKALEQDKKSEDALKELLNSHEGLIQLACPKRLKVQLLISIYAPELREFFDKWTQIEHQLRSCQIALSTGMAIYLSSEDIDIDFLRLMYIDLFNYFDESVNELSGYSNKA
jgi:hypothetical protein